MRLSNVREMYSQPLALAESWNLRLLSIEQIIEENSLTMLRMHVFVEKFVRVLQSVTPERRVSSNRVTAQGRTDQ